MLFQHGTGSAWLRVSRGFGNASELEPDADGRQRQSGPSTYLIPPFLRF